MTDHHSGLQIQRHNQRVWDERARRGQAYTEPLTDGELFDPLRRRAALHWLGGDVRGRRRAVPCRRRWPARRAVRVSRCRRDRRGHQSGNAADRSRRGARPRRQRTDRAGVDGSHADVCRRPFRLRRPACQHVLRAGPGEGVRGDRSCAGRRRRLHQPAKTPTSLQAGMQPAVRGYELVEPYYRRGPLPKAEAGLLREAGTLEYLHRWEDLIGGLCRAGFVIEDLEEPQHADPQAAIGSLGTAVVTLRRTCASRPAAFASPSSRPRRRSGCRSAWSKRGYRVGCHWLRPCS